MSAPNTNKIIGEMLREARIRKNMDQLDVGVCMGVGFQVISDYENGRRNPGVDWVIRVCDCLEIDFGEFMSELNRRRKVALNMVSK